MSKSAAPFAEDPTTSRDPVLTRRAALFGLGAAALTAGCSSTGLDMPSLNLDQMPTGSIRPQISIDAGVTRPELMYASAVDGNFELPEIPFKKIDPKWRRQVVVDPTGEAPGTIVVRVNERHLYWVQEGGDAIRYGVGVGKAGFEWSGRAVIQYTKQWPTWTPPREMIARKPEVAKWAGGQPGGLDNPLGARALYIFKDGQDTLYRIHGSPEWWTIGTQASSGCVRLMNQDIVDLYNRVRAAPNKVPIVVS
ncbi:L,D-transpeptidase [Arvimicrobium flavum]|uniref:L,D-transpeptidase n=1 Tax=Arvimicrobium flavum TaxID=3393320 RepID=UPI00237AD213|nr:L,D-transpeptidase [Mesorhizobium shangrilense]